LIDYVCVFLNPGAFFAAPQKTGLSLQFLANRKAVCSGISALLVVPVITGTFKPFPIHRQVITCEASNDLSYRTCSDSVHPLARVKLLRSLSFRFLLCKNLTIPAAGLRAGRL
jgi:hypothetical protein